MTDTPLSDDVVERVARAIAGEIGIQDFGEPFELKDDLKVAYLDQGEVDFAPIARAALEAARYGEMRDCLKRLEAASTTIAGRLDMLGPRTEVGQAITEARAILSSIGASQP